ncbi:MAG: 6,7-dimethyl-8-ribityllumazine synthase [Proteobacteria bacterium]|nr:6,7-dimethyl-8-ribityllumazine synthase [Pseudomonadota bacterium]
MTEHAGVLIVEGRFYTDIADEMAKGAIAELDKAGVTYRRVAVPGAFEIPAVVRYAVRAREVGADAGQFGGFVTLGCVIQGETDHYNHICRETSRALMDLSVQYSLALGFGILTCPSYELAMARASVTRGNKGAAAALACLRMMDLKRDFRLVMR